MADIRNPEAYEAAVRGRIVQNAMKTWHKNQERSNEIENWIYINSVNNGGRSEFAQSLEFALYNYGKLSPRQCEVVLKKIDEAEDRQAQWEKKRRAEREAAEAIVNGKQVITGTIIKVKYVKNQFAYDDYTVKMLVKDDRGFAVWGSAPSSLRNSVEYDDELIGERVTFSATVEASLDDEKFGFFKRPTKAAIAA